MRRITWSRSARNDLADIDDWFEQLGDPELALEATLAIRGRGSLLERFPAIASPLDKGVRKLVVPGWPYLILYQIRPDAIFILRVRHSHSDWANEL
jgi:toxin ParE1/3/4